MIEKIIFLIYDRVLKPRYLFWFESVLSYGSSEKVRIIECKDLNGVPLRSSNRLKQYLAKRKEKSSWVLFIYEVDEEIAGYSFLHKPIEVEWLDSVPTKQGEARICSAFVESSFRGRGINGVILEAQKSYCLKNRLKIWCVIEKTNRASINSFSKHGGYVGRKNFLIKFMKRNVFSILLNPFELHLLIGSKRASR